MKMRIGACMLGGALIAMAAAASDWTGFRGPGGLGRADDATGLPAKWSETENVTWKRDLPGLGTSSPVMVGNKIFVTCYSGYGESIEEPGEPDDLKRHLVCVDGASGKILWEKTLKPEFPESEYVGRNNTRHGYASSTPVTDGERLYVFFGISGVYAFDLDGKEIWRTKVGDQTHGWGSGTSPVLHDGLVIVNASVESQSLIALDAKTGQKVWTVDGVSRCWSSPMLVEVGGKQELVLAIPDGGKARTSKLKGFDPATGELLWYCVGPPDSYLCSSTVSHHGIVYAIGARKTTAMAVRAGGKGDVSESRVLWTARQGSNVTSPIYLDGHLYIFTEKGKVSCLDAKTGEVVFEEALEPAAGLVYASPLAADGKLYASSQDNGTYVVEAKPKFKQLAVNTFKDDPSRVNASIAVSGNSLILRTDKAIYRLAK